MKINKPSKNKILICIVLAALLAAGAFFYLLYTKQSVYSPDEDISYVPATEEEIAQAAANKSRAVERMEKDEQSTTETNGPKSTKVSVTYWGQDDNSGDFRAGVGLPAIYEDGGSCMLEMTLSNGSVVRATRDARKDAKSTTCGSLLIPSKDLVSGKANFIVKYVSNDYRAESGSIAVDIR